MSVVQDICKSVPSELLYSRPHLSHLDEIALHIKSWEDLAPYIGISNEEQKKISELYRNHYRIQKQKALRAWRRNLGDRATLISLIHILCKEGMTVVAERMKEVIRRRPTCLQVFAEYIREYHRFDPNAHAVHEKTIYRFDRNHDYVDLLLHEISTEAAVSSGISEQGYKIVKLHDVLNNQLEKIAILFEGIAGSGKTTMSTHICLEWTEGKLLTKFQILIQVHLGDPKVRSARCLADLIPDTEKEMRDEVAAAIIDEKGKGVCILLEGLDEAPDDLWNSLLFELIAGNGKQESLSHLSFIFTARPGCQQLKDLEGKLTSRIVIKGFNKKSVVQFINNSSTDSTGAALVNKLENNPRLAALCSLPVNTATMAFLVSHFEKKIPETQTGISKLLLSNFLARHIQKRVGSTAQKLVTIENFDEDLQVYPGIRDAFRKLCALSYSALINKKRYFTAKDLSKADMNVENDSLGLLHRQIMTTKQGLDGVYCFPHLSFQEFLAAVHLSSMNEHQQVVEVERIFSSNPLSPVLPLYAGLTRLENKPVFEVLSSAIDESLDTATIFTLLQLNPSHLGDPRRRALAFFNCLYECQKEELMSPKYIQLKPSFLSDTMYEISMTQFSMTPADCLALGYFVKHATLNMKTVSLIQVHLGKCSDAGISSFLTEVKKDIHSKTRGGVGLFMNTYVPQDESSLLALRQFLQGQSNVRMLQLLVGSGMSRSITKFLLKCIIEGISRNSSCHMISITFANRLNQSYIHYLILIVFPLNTLRMLCLCDTNLQKSIHLFSEALKSSKIPQISLNNCNIDDVGAESLGKAISKNGVLKKFDIKSNPYTTYGMIQFLKCLISEETVLSQLELNDEVYIALLSVEEYHTIILQIRKFRMKHNKPALSINPAMEESVTKKVDEYASSYCGVCTLSPQLTRRESLFEPHISQDAFTVHLKSPLKFRPNHSQPNSGQEMAMAITEDVHPRVGTVDDCHTEQFVDRGDTRECHFQSKESPLDRVISDYHMANIAKDLAEWEEIAPSILLSESEQKEIKEDYQGRYKLQKRQALHAWHNKSGNKATYRALSSIFQSEGLNELAEVVKGMASDTKQLAMNNEIIDQFHYYLLDCYCDLPYPPMQQLSSIELQCQHKYIDLTLREVSVSINLEEQSTTSTHNVNGGPNTNRLVELSAVLSSETFSGGSIVLFEGVGGSGKTVISWHICRKWAEKELLQQFHLLIHIQVRNPEIQAAEHFPDVIPYTDKRVCEEVATAIYDQQGKGVCILLDGLDDASSSESLFHVLFGMLIGRQRAYIPQISFIITTRPNLHITSLLQPVLKSKIMLEGFSKVKLQEFFRGALGGQNKQYISLMATLKTNPQLEWVCTHPINAVIIAVLAQICEGDLPVVQTELYKALINHFLNRHIQIRSDSAQHSSEPIESFRDLSIEMKQPFLKLSEWAYKSSLLKKQLFTVKELGKANVEIDNMLGFLQIQPKITMYGTERYYSFPHLSIQEFLAAVHVSLKPDKFQPELIEQLLDADPLNYALPFYAGLTGLSNLDARKLLSKALKHPLHDLRIRAALNPKFESMETADPRLKTLALFNCLYECQNQSIFELPDVQLPHFDISTKAVHDQLQMKPQFKKEHIVSFTGLGLTPTDCIAIGYFMRMNSLLIKEDSFIWFQMGMCSDVGMASFMKEIRKGVNTKTPLQVTILIKFSTLGMESMLAIRELLKGQSNIRALLIQGGISSVLMFKALKSIIEGLTDGASCYTVSISDVKSIHVHYLILLVRFHTSLEGFCITSGDLQKEVRLFSEALKFSKIICLELKHCEINNEGLLLLGKAMCVNVHILELWFAENPITANGVMKFLINTLSPPNRKLVMIDDRIYQALRKTPEYNLLQVYLQSIGKKERFIVMSYYEAGNWRKSFEDLAQINENDYISFISRTDAAV